MPRAPKICSHVGCPNVQPCATHPSGPWANSKRRTRTISGSAQQARAARVMAQHRGICHVCGKDGADEVDHIVCLAEGGADTEDNLAPIHSTPCHRDKTHAESKRGRTR